MRHHVLPGVSRGFCWVERRLVYLSLLEIAMADARLRPDARTTLTELAGRGVPQVLVAGLTMPLRARMDYPHETGPSAAILTRETYSRGLLRPAAA